jgi:hypothetical protein
MWTVGRRVDARGTREGAGWGSALLSALQWRRRAPPFIDPTQRYAPMAVIRFPGVGFRLAREGVAGAPG